MPHYAKRMQLCEEKLGQAAENDKSNNTPT